MCLATLPEPSNCCSRCVSELAFKLEFGDELRLIRVLNPLWPTFNPIWTAFASIGRVLAACRPERPET